MVSKKGAAKIPDKQGNNRESVGYKRPPKTARWKPGQSGNPKGRPKSITFSEACRKALAEAEGDETVAEVLAKAAIEFARKGSAQHLKEINDRVEGKARQPIDVSVTDPKEQLASLLGVSVDELPE